MNQNGALNPSDSVVVSNQNVVMAPLPDRKTLPVSYRDWKILKRMIRSMVEPFKFYEAFGGITAGAAFTFWFQLWQNRFAGDWLETGSGVAAVSLTFISLLFFVFAINQRVTSTRSIRDVIAFCKEIEDHLVHEFPDPKPGQRELFVSWIHRQLPWNK